jgi:hypothetical protein
MEKLLKASILIPNGDKMEKEKDTLMLYLPSYIKGKKYLPKEIIEMCIALKIFFPLQKANNSFFFKDNAFNHAS